MNEWCGEDAEQTEGEALLSCIEARSCGSFIPISSPRSRRWPRSGAKPLREIGEASPCEIDIRRSEQPDKKSVTARGDERQEPLRGTVGERISHAVMPASSTATHTKKIATGAVQAIQANAFIGQTRPIANPFAM